MLLTESRVLEDRVDSRGETLGEGTEIVDLGDAMRRGDSVDKAFTGDGGAGCKVRES